MGPAEAGRDCAALVLISRFERRLWGAELRDGGWADHPLGMQDSGPASCELILGPGVPLCQMQVIASAL